MKLADSLVPKHRGALPEAIKWLALGGGITTLLIGLLSRPHRAEGNKVDGGLLVAQGAKAGARLEERSDAAKERSRALELLKARWLKTDDPEALSRESVDLLLCSDELVDLIDFLSERDIDNGIGRFAESIFQSERAAEGRDFLIAMKERYPENSWRFSYRQHWSKKAGFFCPPEHFEEFHKALGGGLSSQEALLGFNLARMKTDPAAAVASTMDSLRKSLDSQSRDQCLVEQMRELQKDADFGAIEGLLPWDQPPFPGSPWYQGREVLLAKWAEVDAAGATNYFIQHPERLGPEMIKPVTKTVVSANFEDGMKWVQGLPKGDYLDDAMSEATLFLLMMEDKGMAKQLAGKVDNEELRQHLMKALSEEETPVGELEEP